MRPPRRPRRSAPPVRRKATCARNWPRSTRCWLWRSDTRPGPMRGCDWLVDWIKANLLAGADWNRRRLIIFTEYEDTRRWLERRLREALADTDRADDRIGVFTGATGSDRREEVKRAFNADPDAEPLRILICTDAAREGINLQTYCSDLIHFDLPWNPSRLEQRNGRIDRKLQPAKQIVCRYFRYEQREADIVLEALVRKTETIREQLGSVGQVIEDRITKRLAEGGIGRGQGAALARAIAEENDAERLARARAEMDDEERARHERLLQEQDDLRRALERSSERVGVNPEDLQRVAAAALSRAGLVLDSTRGEPVGNVATFHLNPSDPAFAKDAGWDDAFDDLRIRPRKRGERLGDWRRNAPIRSIAFEPPVLSDGRDATDVVQVHLEHRLVRRLLSRFLSQGFQSKLSRVSVIVGPGAQPRVVLMGRLAVYGAGAARLHEEVIPITAIWTEAERDRKPLRPLGESGEERTLNQLEEALRDARRSAGHGRRAHPGSRRQGYRRPRPGPGKDRGRATGDGSAQLVKRGEEEARSLSELLEQQRSRIAKAAKDFDPNQLTLDLVPEERREREADRRHWEGRLTRLERELRDEPERSAQFLRSARASAGTGRARLSLAGIGVSAMATELYRDPDLEWLDHVQPVGLVVAPSLLKELGLSPLRQTPDRHRRGRRASRTGAVQARPSGSMGLRRTGARLGGAPCRRRAGRPGHSG